MSKMKKEKLEEVVFTTPEVAEIKNMEKELEYNPEKENPYKLEHFPIYNAWARKNKKLVKVPTEDFYPKVKIRFQRFDQPQNVLKTRIRTKDIDWTGQLMPGKTYHLPIPVIQFLNGLAVPIFAEVKVQDGSDIKTETRQVGEQSRFSCQQLEFAA